MSFCPFDQSIRSNIKTDQPLLNDLWRRAAITTYNDHGASFWDGRIVLMGPPWLRDHVHELKGLKYLMPDMKSGLETFFRRQFDDGQFPDFFVPLSNMHALFVHPRFERIDEEHGQVFIRVPVEADLEYLAVEGVFTSWQSTGDDEWMSQQLAILEKGLAYLMSDPSRWSSEHGLVMRPFTIDTWDFLDYFTRDWMTTNVAIRVMNEKTPFCLFYGDNSGLYAAANLMASMYERISDPKRAEEWRETAAKIRHRANELLWNGLYYKHQVHLDAEQASRYDETGRLSLSNPYTINRGMPSHEMAVSIIDEYRRRRDGLADKSFAEWYTINPPYEPKFAWFEPGEYANGGVFLAVAGELAKAAFNHGRETYGVDILQRLSNFIREKNEIGFMYWPDRRGYGGGPVGWCSAAIMSAMMEGLAGVVDEGFCFQEVTLFPRWIAAGVADAEVEAHYPASGKSLAYTFKHDLQEKQILIDWNGSSASVRLSILLPENTRAVSAIVDGQTVSVETRVIENSSYAEIATATISGSAKVQYQKL